MSEEMSSASQVASALDSAPEGRLKRRTARSMSLGDLARPRIRNQSAILVALAVGIALFVLVAAAFSAMAESRVVAAKSNELHSFDEVLRNTITARSKVGSALNFALLDQSQNTDSSAIITAEVEEARRNLSQLLGASDNIADDNPAQDQIAPFVASTRSVMDQLEDARQPGADGESGTSTVDSVAAARLTLLSETDGLYNDLVDSVVAERDSLVIELREADEDLGRLGALATFIIAFFVPTVAMFVYRQITRRQRETIELAGLLSEARTSMDWRADVIRSAADLAEAEIAALPASSMTASLRSRLRDLDFLVGATALGHGYTFEALTVGDLRAEVQNHWPDLVNVAGSGTDLMWGDRDSILLLCDDIVRNASRRGADRVLISGGAESDSVWLAITDNGRPLNPAAVSDILDTATLVDAAEEHAGRRLDDDTSLVLLMGRMIAPALGGSFEVDGVGSNTRFTLTLPVVQTRRTATPTLTSADA